MPSSIVTRIRSHVGRTLGDKRHVVVLAVSGGVDSMVLLDATAAALAHDRFVVATFDHGTGEAATGAADLVAFRCRLLGVECRRGVAAAAAQSENGLRVARWKFLT